MITFIMICWSIYWCLKDKPVLGLCGAPFIGYIFFKLSEIGGCYGS